MADKSEEEGPSSERTEREDKAPPPGQDEGDKTPPPRPEEEDKTDSVTPKPLAVRIKQEPSDDIKVSVSLSSFTLSRFQVSASVCFCVLVTIPQLLVRHKLDNLLDLN